MHYDTFSEVSSNRDVGNNINKMQAQRRINVKLIPSPENIKETPVDSSIEVASPSKLQSILTVESCKSRDISLHDREDLQKNLKVRQEVKETRRGDISQINTTNTMEMYNSTIMKIVVTQKRTNVNSPQEGRRKLYDRQNFPQLVKSPRGGIFGNSVLVNGVAMKTSTSGVDGSATA